MISAGASYSFASIATISAILWVPSYAAGSPELAGIPFFYWYQFLWVLISAGITALVYVCTRDTPAEGVGVEGDSPVRRDRT